MNKSIDTIISIFFGSMIILLVILILSFRMVSAGHVKVVTQFGKVTGRVLNPGAHWIVPLAQGTRKYSTRKVTYETTTEKKQETSDADYKDYPVDTNTNDGQQVDVFYTVRFSIDPARATYVAQNIGSENALVEKIVKTESRIWTRNIPREYDAADLYTGNVVDVQNKIADRLRPIFKENGVILDSVGIREIKFTGDYVKAIEQKQIEAVRVETEQNRAAAAKFEKEAQITKAQAEAEAQRLQRETLNEQVIRKLSLEVDRIKAEAMKVSAEKGQQVVPSTIVGENASTLLQLP